MANTYAGQFDIANVAAYLSKTFADQVFNGRPLFAKLNADGNKKRQNGGFTLRQPLMVASNTSGGWMASGYDQIDFTPQGGTDYAEFPIKLYHKTVVMSEVEQDQNSGESEQIDLWEFKVSQAKLAAQTQFNQDLYKDGTQDSAAITGLKALVGNTGTYAGISRTSNSYWQCQIDTTTEALDDDDMLSMYNLCSQNGESFPNLIITTRALYEKYHQMLVPNVRYEDKQMANLGFQHVTFQGIPVVWDNDCQSGTMYFLNTKHIFLRYLNDKDFKWTAKTRMEQQLVDSMIVRWYGNLTTDSVRHQGKLTNRS